MKTSIKFQGDQVVLGLPLSQLEAWQYVQEEVGRLEAWAAATGRKRVEVRYLVEAESGRMVPCSRGYRVPARAVSAETLGNPDKVNLPDRLSNSSIVGSYGASGLRRAAGAAEVMDFIAGQQAEGRICTVMGMGSDKFLFVNGAQVADRGGNAETWIGVDAKALVWGRSLTGTLPGRERGVNYYAQLHELLERDGSIPGFEYCVTRPSGDLHRDTSTYYLLDDYLGIPARVAVSKVGESQLVEAAAA